CLRDGIPTVEVLNDPAHAAVGGPRAGESSTHPAKHGTRPHPRPRVPPCEGGGPGPRGVADATRAGPDRAGRGPAPVLVAGSEAPRPRQPAKADPRLNVGNRLPRRPPNPPAGLGGRRRRPG